MFGPLPVARRPTNHSPAGMVLLHLRSSQAEFDAYLFATHGPTRARRAWLGGGRHRSHTLTEKYMHSRGSPSSKGRLRRLKQLPTYLARPGGPKVDLPTYLRL